MNIQEKLTERIKEQFVNLLTDEELETIVKKEIDSFFDENTKSYIKVEKKYDYYKAHYTELSCSEDMSPIRSIVYQVLIGMTAEKIKNEHIQKYFSEQIAKEDGTINTKISEQISNTIPIAINQYFENIARNMTMNLQQSLMNNSNGGY